MKNRSSAGGLVYSTETGRMCPACRHPVAQCACGQAAPPQGDGVVRVSRETKGRGGKAVTVVRGVALPADRLADLGKQLRTACSSGGTVKDGVIEVQGDHSERVVEWLKARGHNVKQAGGGVGGGGVGVGVGVGGRPREGGVSGRPREGGDPERSS